MANLSVHDLIKYFYRVPNTTITPTVKKAVVAVRVAANAGEIDLLEQLANSMVSSYVHVNPTTVAKEAERNALYVFATLCYLADHEFTNPKLRRTTRAMREALHTELQTLPMADRMYIHENGPAKTYANRNYHGNAMIQAETIIEGIKHLDFQKDIFQEGTKPAPSQFRPPSTLVSLI